MCQMKKYHIYSSGKELVLKKNITSTNISSTINIDLVPALDKEFLDDNMDNAVKQGLRIIMDYLKGSSFTISNIKVEDQYLWHGIENPRHGKSKYITFKNNNRIQGIFKLEEMQ